MSTPLQLEGLVFLGESSFAERLRVQVRRIAPHFRTALLTGEPGTGKEEVARELHRLSPVAEHPFLACPADDFAAGAVDPVRFGTLYLERLEALNPSLQSRLLARLQRLDARPGEIRIIVSTESPLRGMVASGRLRQDLYIHIGAIEIRLPRLRDRPEDLPAMLSGLPLAPLAVSRLREHTWPGNLRELVQVLTQAHLAADGLTIEPSHLPVLIAPPAVPQQASDARLELVLKRHVADVLERCAGNKLRASEMLGISRSTLYRMLDAPAIEA